VKTTQERAELLGSLIPFENFEAAVRWRAAHLGQSTNPKESEFNAFFERVVHPALRNMINFMVSVDALPPMPDYGQHGFDLVEIWNAVRAGNYGGSRGEEYHLKRLVHELARPLGAAASDAAWKLHRQEPVDLKTSYKAFLDGLAGGNLETYNTAETYGFHSGVKARIQLQDWNPSLFHFDRAQGKEVPVQLFSLNIINQAEIRIRDGRMLATDFFRFKDKAFQAIIDRPDGGSVNSTAGCVEETLAQLEKGIIYVQSGNSFPSILRSADGTLLIGRPDWDEPGLDVAGATELGSVCCDLWWTTIIERVHLEELLAEVRSYSIEEARADLDKYLAKEGGNVAQFTIEPGTKHLYFSGNHEDFALAFHSPSVQEPKGFEPFFVLADRELELTPRPAIEAQEPTEDTPELA
jgi:hypothetical protein